MATQIIRNLPKQTIVSLDELARRNSESRESYVRDLLNHHVMFAEVEGIHYKYENLVKEISHDVILALNMNTEALNEFNQWKGIVDHETGTN